MSDKHDNYVHFELIECILIDKYDVKGIIRGLNAVFLPLVMNPLGPLKHDGWPKPIYHTFIIGYVKMSP